jgi:hypothetical protein
MIVLYIFPSSVVACILVFGGRRSRGRRRELPRLPETCPPESQRDFNIVRSSPVLLRPVYKPNTLPAATLDLSGTMHVSRLTRTTKVVQIHLEARERRKKQKHEWETTREHAPC